MEKVNDIDIIATEVNMVLNSVPKREFYKIPKKITDYFGNFDNFDLVKKIDFTKSFLEQDISEKAKDIILAISFNYWIYEDDRKKIIKKMKLNEQEITEKYKYENLFIRDSKNMVSKVKDDEKQQLNIKKSTWITRLINRIRKRFF